VPNGSFASNILLFGRLLRRAGLDIHHARLLDAMRALEWVNIGSRVDVAATLRALLVHNRDDLARFDAAFEQFFRAHGAPEPGMPLFALGERPRVVVRPAAGAPAQIELEDAQRDAPHASRGVGAWSAAGVSRTKDFSDFTDAELERARAFLERAAWTFSVRRTRRWHPACSPTGTSRCSPTPTASASSRPRCSRSM